MQGIERSQGDGPWIQSASDNQRCHFKPSKTAEQEPDGFSMGISKPTRMDPIPYLVFRLLAGKKGVGLKTFRWTSALRQQLGENHRFRRKLSFFSIAIQFIEQSSQAGDGQSG